MTKLLPYIIGFVCCTSLLACSVDREPCLLPKTTLVRLGTYQIDIAGKTIDSLLPSPMFVAIAQDSLKGLRFQDRTSKFSLTLANHTDSCQYLLIPDSSIGTIDTLTFHYQRRIQFLSNSCGYTFFYQLTNLLSTHHNIDSVIIKNDQINNDANSPEHVQIYF